MIELLLQAEAALSAGRLDRAESLYRQVADADPRNSIAVVGLARVAAERSDEVGALTLARRALSIDPENAAAQRTVRQLEELLTSRGVSAAATEAASSPTAASTEPLAAAGDARGPATPDRSAATPPRRSYVDRLLRRPSDR